MKIYFILDNNKHEGPFSVEELKAKGIRRDTMVWKEGLPSWVPAREVEELDYILPAASAVQPPTPPPLAPLIEEMPMEPEPEPVEEVEEVKPVVEEKKQAEPVVAAPLADEIKPVEEKPAPVAPAPKPVAPVKKEVFSLAEETPPAKKQVPAPVPPKAAKPVVPPKPKPVVDPNAPKKKTSNIVVFAVLVVLVGGGVGYYLYDQNQKAKLHTEAENAGVLQPDTSTATPVTQTTVPVTNPVVDNTVTTQDTVNNNGPDETVVTKPDPKKDIKKNIATTTTTPVKKTDSKPDNQGKEKPVPDDPKPVSKGNPLEHLSVNGNYKKNILGEAVLEGKIHNSDIDAKFNTLVMEVKFLSATGEVLKTQQFTKQGALAPGGDLSFKYRSSAPKDTKSASFKVISAL
jgi:hypothetical protein